MKAILDGELKACNLRKKTKQTQNKKNDILYFITNLIFLDLSDALQR